MQGLSSKLEKFRRLPFVDQLLFARAVFWLGVARLRLAITPFRRLSLTLAADGNGPGDEPDAQYLARVGYAIRAAANNVPWRSDCFPQTIAARSLLRRRGYASTIHLGVDRKEQGGIAGHAWLTCGDTVVTGGDDLDRYTEMHRFNA